jgi:hypothetical protein
LERWERYVASSPSLTPASSAGDDSTDRNPHPVTCMLTFPFDWINPVAGKLCGCGCGGQDEATLVEGPLQEGKVSCRQTRIPAWSILEFLTILFALLGHCLLSDVRKRLLRESHPRRSPLSTIASGRCRAFRQELTLVSIVRAPDPSTLGSSTSRRQLSCWRSGTRLRRPRRRRRRRCVRRRRHSSRSGRCHTPVLSLRLPICGPHAVKLFFSLRGR